MTVGAFGLIFGPWFENTYLLVPGLMLHLAATIWLLFNVVKPLWGDRQAWTTRALAHRAVLLLAPGSNPDGAADPAQSAGNPREHD